MKESKTSNQAVTRRTFVKSVAAAGIVTGIGARSWGEEIRKGDMIYRILGRTGEKVSAIGLGGSHIGKLKDEKESIALIRSAIDRGLTFMDNS